MFKPISALLLAALVLSGCGRARDSAFNPFNWFGQSTSAPTAQTDDSGVNPLIPSRRESIFRQERDDSYRGTDVLQVTEVVAERRPGGAILRVTGVGGPGAFSVKLVKLDDESGDGVLTYALRALQPPQGGNKVTVTAADWLTDNDLSGVRTIKVKSQGNTRSIRR